MDLQIPNMLTTMRLLLVPVFGYLLFANSYKEAFVMLLVIGITDVLDGYIARKYNMITKLGTVLDPIADKLVQATAIAVLTYNLMIPFVIIAVVVIKELMLGLGAFILYRNGQVVISSNMYGKLATVLFYTAILSTISFKILGIEIGYIHFVINGVFLIAVAATLYALYMYMKEFMTIQKKA